MNLLLDQLKSVLTSVDAIVECNPCHFLNIEAKKWFQFLIIVKETKTKGILSVLIWFDRMTYIKYEKIVKMTMTLSQHSNWGRLSFCMEIQVSLVISGRYVLQILYKELNTANKKNNVRPKLSDLFNLHFQTLFLVLFCLITILDAMR
jgi:hypothetical protein